MSRFNEFIYCQYFVLLCRTSSGLLEVLHGKTKHWLYIHSLTQPIRCCSSSFCGVIRYPSSQASADPTSAVYIVAFSFSSYLAVSLYCLICSRSCEEFEQEMLCKDQYSAALIVLRILGMQLLIEKTFPTNE